jgi:hypothetical protein
MSKPIRRRLPLRYSALQERRVYRTRIGKDRSTRDSGSHSQSRQPRLPKQPIFARMF